ncbi:DHA2 family efflux MFS transporter permease subunit [Kitasatospora sp. NPDC056184]|uniref:DHA2 family efflux MFS transporter permease subunit n=1 Tax=Kitasatospora sp. NPDC056184 TaxID=3345738 RepID=UPI0035E0CE4A
MNDHRAGAARPAGSAAPAGSTDRPLSRLGLVGLMLGIVLATLDGQIVSTALPTVVGDLGGLDRFSWVVTAYLLAMSAATPVWGKLGDLYHRKGAFLASVGLFLLGSVLCGTAQDMPQLIAFRALQGLGAGGLLVGALSVIGALAAAEERGRIQSLIGVMLPVAFVGGPLLGGFITDYAHWRWTFYVNVPVGLVALLAAARGVRTGGEPVKGGRIDYLGTLLLTTGILAITLVGTWAGNSYAWLSPQILGLGALSVLVLAWFVRVEQRAAEPITPLVLFRNREFGLAQVISFLVGATMVSVLNYLPQYLQFVQGASSTASGMLILPMMTGMLSAQLLTGRLTDRGGLDRVLPIAGSAVMLLGTLVLLLLGTGTPVAIASALTLVMGLGVGVLLQSTMLTTMNNAPKRHMGAATGTVTLARTIGGSLGVAVLGAVQADRMSTVLADRLGPDAERDLTSGGQLTPAVLKDMPAPTRDAVETAVTSGLHGVVASASLLAVLAFAVAWFVRPTPPAGAADAPDPAPAAAGVAPVRTPPAD